MLVRRFTCKTCGAPSETSQEALLVVCRHCGSFVGFDEEAIYKGDSFAAAGRKMICGVGTIEAARAFARIGTLFKEMDSAAKDVSRDSWRILAQEYYSLFTVAYPDHCPQDELDRRDWIVSTVAFTELSAFVPAIATLQEKYNNLAASLTSSDDPVSHGEKMLAAAQEYFSACLSHPELPAGVGSEGALHHAKEMVRMSVVSLTMILGEGVVAEIRSTILGDKVEEGEVKCPSCGTIVKSSPCPHCGSALGLEKDPPWLTQTLAIFQAVLPELNARGALDGVEPIMSVMAYVFIPRQSGGELSTELAAEFIRRAIPWVSWEQLSQGISVYRTMFEEGTPDDMFINDLLAELSPWQTFPEKRPAPPKPVQIPKGPVGPDDPWVAHASSLWSMGMGAGEELSVESLVSFCLAPFFQNQPISFYQAMAFFENVAPEVQKSEIARAAKILRSGFDEGLPVTQFLHELISHCED